MKRMLCLAACLLLLSGCGGQELKNVSLVRTLGVDGPGPVAVTAVAGEGEEEALFSCGGADIVEAQAVLETLGSQRLAVTHVGQVVLGQTTSAKSLWDEVVHRESGYGATVWLAEGSSAGDLLARAEDPAGRLKHLEESGVAAPTLLEAVSALAREGGVTVPVVGLRDGELQVVGDSRISAEGVFD